MSLASSDKNTQINQSGRVQWVWVAALTATLVLIIAGLYTFFSYEVGQIGLQKFNSLESDSLSKVERIHDWRKERLKVASTFATDPHFVKELTEWLQEPKNSNLMEQLKAWTVLHRASKDFTDVIILDLEGHILFSAEPDSPELSPMEATALSEAISSRSAILTDLYRSSRGTVQIDVIAPVLDQNGKPVAAVLIRENAVPHLDLLTGFYPTRTKTAETYLVRRDGADLLFLTDLRFKSDAGLNLRLPLTSKDLPAVQAVLGKKGKYEGKDYRGVAVIANLLQIPDSPWFMVAEIDAEEISEEARLQTIYVGFFTGFLLLGIVMAVVYGFQRGRTRLYEDLYQAERLQREAQDEFQTTVYSIGDAVITTGRDGLVKHMNPVAEHLTGWIEPEARGKRLEEVFRIINEESREPFDTPVERVLQTGNLVGLANHTTLISRDGSERPIADSASPITESDGAIVGVVLVFRDQTEERAAMRRLRDNQQRLSIIADHIYDWEYWIKPDNELEFCSPSCQRITGYRPDEFMSDPQLLRKIVHPDDLTIYDQHVAHVERDPRICEVDYRIITRKGEVVWLSHCCAPANGNGGAPIGRRISNRDVTKRKLVEEDRRRSLERQNRLNQLQQDLLGPGALTPKLKRITDTIVDVFDADFCRIWRIAPGDLCEDGCMHSEATEGPHVCIDRKRCLRLETSSGRYTHTDGEKHRRVPFGAYKIGRVASGADHKFLTNDATNDPRIHDHQWARELGLVSFAGYQLSPTDGERLGVLALFCKHSISPEEDTQLDALSKAAARIIHSAMIEENLRESEERFLQVADVAGEWIWEVDEKGLFLYCSSAAFQVLGYRPEELVGQRHFWEFFDQKGCEDSALKPLDVFNDRQRFQGYVSPVVHKDGHTVITKTSGTPIIDDDGKFAGYRGTNTDITEQVRASESQELLAAVVEHAAESIVVTDTKGTIKYVNPAFEQTSGYLKDETIGTTPRILKSGKQPDYFYADLWDTIARGEIWRGRFINKKKDGSLFEEEATISPLRDAYGQVANYVAVKRDVTKEVSLQNQLTQSQKMEAIGTLAGGIAHDFNNILFAIVGYTELAIEDLPDGSESQSDMEQVISAAKRASEMVKQILTFSRQAEPQRIPLDLGPIVKEGLKFLRGSIPSTIEIRQRIGSSLGKVEADPTQMHQVLMNLCSNAAQAMKETNGIMTVELTDIDLDADYSDQHLSLTPGRYVKLSVSDTGYGIAPANIDRIFEPYFTTKGIGEGTGLGLAVTHGIVTGHGGAITVYSAPEQGSTFNVFLPVSQEETEREDILGSAPIPSGNERILLVDDEEILVEMGQATLERLGYRVVTSLDPLKALEIFRSDPSGFDLVLTDLMMPKITGLNLAKQIKAMNPDIPIVLCTGFGHKFTEEEAQDHGFSGIISKPISKKDVAQIVRKALDQKT